MAEKFANEAQSTLAEALTAGGTTLKVTSAALFPTEGNFRLRIGNEYLIVTAVAGTTFTVTRAAEGSAAVEHAKGATVTHVLTAGAINAMPLSATAAAETKTNIFELGVGFYNIREYGAVPGTDCHEAVKKAIEAAEAAGGGIIYFPPTFSGSKWKTSSNFTFKPSKKIHFMGSLGLGEIELTSDLEYGQHLFDFSTETENSNNVEHHFWNIYAKGPETKPTSPAWNTPGEYNGYPPCYASGIMVWNLFWVEGCKMERFYTGYGIRGFNNFLYRNKDSKCFYGVYRGPNSRNFELTAFGGTIIRDHESNPARWANYGQHSNIKMENEQFQYMNMTNAPYCFYREGPQGPAVGFFSAYRLEQINGQENGNATIYDECTDASYSAEIKASSSNGFSAEMPLFNVNFNAFNRVGNAQLLDLSLATAGTFKIVVPAQIGPSGSTTYAGGTTAAIKFNATNAEIESAIQAVSSAACEVATYEGKKLIWLRNNSSMMAGTEMTLKTEELTGSASFAAPAPPPGFGPLQRPTTCHTVTVKNATGGNFKLKVKIGEGATVESENIAYNVSQNTFYEKLCKMSNLGPYGVSIDGHTGTLHVYFTGKNIEKSVTLEADATGLTGEGAKVELGTIAVSFAKRHAEYSIDVDDSGITVPSCGVGFAVNSVGFLRGGGGFFLGEGAANRVMEDSRIQAGTAFIAAGGENDYKSSISELRSNLASHRMFYVTGPIARGSLMANSGTKQNAVIYPKEEAKGGLARPHCGFMAITVPEGTSMWAPVCYAGLTEGGVPKALYDAAGTPASAKALKPSSETAGQVRATTEASDKVVAQTMAEGSGGKVSIEPRNCR